MGAWVRATFSIWLLRLTMAFESPIKRTVLALFTSVASGTSVSLSAAVTTSRRRARSMGLAIKSKAPDFNASTAVSILPNAVIMAMGILLYFF